MKRFLFRLPIVVALALSTVLPVLADTIRLKDGSVIHGQIVSFKNEQFTILVGGGARGRKSQITVYMEDVESIDFDSSGNGPVSNQDNSSSQSSQRPSQPSYQQPANNNPNDGPIFNQPANTTTQQTNTSSQTSANPNPTFFPVNVKVRADNTSNGWTNSGLVVRRGQRLRINASGRVGLGSGRFATPDGI